MWPWLFLIIIHLQVFNIVAIEPIQKDSNCFLTFCLKNILKQIENRNNLYTFNIDLRFDLIPTIRVNLQETLINFRFEKSHVCIINADSDFDSQLQEIFSYQYLNPRGLFIVITDNVSKLFSTAAQYYIQKLLILKSVNSSYQEIYSYLPYVFESVNQPNVQPFQISSCLNGDIKENIDFAKLNNLPPKWRNTTLTIVNNIFPPYTICAKNRGIETEIFDMIVEKLQFTPKYTKTDHFTLWGFKVNGSYNLLLENLEKRRGELALGGFHMRAEEHLDFDMASTHMEDGLHWMVPKAKIMPFWKRTTQIFSLLIYSCILAAFLLTSFICYLLYKESMLDSSFAFFQILVEVGLNKMPHFRIVTLSWTISCLIISTVYKGKLMDAISRNTYEHQINSLNDIIVYQKIIRIDPFIASFYADYKNEDEEQVYKTYLACEDHFLNVNITAYVQNSVTVTFQRAYEYDELKEDENGVLLVHLIKPSIYSIKFHLFFLRGYPMLDQVDDLLSRIRASGFIQRQYDKLSHNTVVALSKKEGVFTAEVLNLEQMQIAFFMWCLGISASIALFALEHIYSVTVKKLINKDNYN